MIFKGDFFYISLFANHPESITVVTHKKSKTDKQGVQRFHSSQYIHSHISLKLIRHYKTTVSTILQHNNNRHCMNTVSTNTQ